VKHEEITLKDKKLKKLSTFYKYRVIMGYLKTQIPWHPI